MAAVFFSKTKVQFVLSFQQIGLLPFEVGDEYGAVGHCFFGTEKLLPDESEPVADVQQLDGQRIPHGGLS